MPRLVWDEVSKKIYETGVKNGVLYPQSEDGTYPKGFAWNGLTSVAESPSGAESNPIYADDIKYIDIRSAEEFGATIEAYTYPKEWESCDGSAEITDGIVIGQQTRKSFGMCYRTTIGNDVQYNDYGYKLHIIYNATASPSEKTYQTINDSPEAIAFSWEVSTTPVNVTGYKPTSQLVIDSTKTSAEKMKAIEDVLFGTDDAEARLPMPDEILTIVNGAAAG